jgi:hypothetical protein
MLVGLTGRCRFSEGTLYLVDERFGPVWALRGIEKLGGKADREYATRLAKNLPSDTSSGSAEYGVAVRILGCAYMDRVRVNK